MVKAAVVVLTVLMIFAGLYSLLLIVRPQIVAESTLKARTGQTLASTPDKGAADALVIQTRHLGVMALGATIAVFFILYAGFRKVQRWAWWGILIVGLIVWGYGLYTEIAEGDVLNMVLHLVGIGLLIVGVLLPVKDFFAKSKT